MNYLQSITEIKKEDCYETGGSRPLKVFCSDFNYYVCKYRTSAGFPFLLFNEYIAARFLKIWQLPVPDFTYVDIKREHAKQTLLPFHFFDVPSFGSKFMGDFKEVDKFFLETPLLRKDNVTGRDTFLKIALFDIWLCNEDRHYGNLNLLYNLKENVFVPIDHTFCFNSATLDKEAILITENESILSTPFLSRFFDRTLQTKSNDIRLNILDDFKINVQTCNDELDNILNEIPSAWNPDTGFLKERLRFFFSKQWLKKCSEYFTTLYFLKNK